MRTELTLRSPLWLNGKLSQRVPSVKERRGREQTADFTVADGSWNNSIVRVWFERHHIITPVHLEAGSQNRIFEFFHHNCEQWNIQLSSLTLPNNLPFHSLSKDNLMNGAKWSKHFRNLRPFPNEIGTK